MSGNDRNSGPDSFAADYRDSFPDPNRRETGQKPRGRRSAAGHPPSAGAPAPRRSRLDNDTELDDFLSENDGGDDEERLLTKWDDGMGGPEEPEKTRPRRHGRRRYGILTGSLVLLLALVGVGFLATAAGTKIHSVLTDDTKLRQYDRFLTVVVAQDPEPFASPDKADPYFVLNASLWQTMTGDGAAGYTDYDDAGRTIVPLGDVLDACHEIFGPDCQLQPKNPEEETFFTYDSANAQFHVALYSLDSTYVPYTEKAGRSGDSTVLRVGYVPPSDETRVQSAASSDVAPKPVKYMEYVMKTNPSTRKEYLYAVKPAGEK